MAQRQERLLAIAHPDHRDAIAAAADRLRAEGASQ
jgi:acyl-CoA hydrolase